MPGDPIEHRRLALSCAEADLRGMGYDAAVLPTLIERAQAAASTSPETFEDALYRLVLDLAADLHRFGQRCPFTRGNRCDAPRGDGVLTC